jgi:two-component system sensor histidine kinase PilS (NtrC family)
VSELAVRGAPDARFGRGRVERHLAILMASRLALSIAGLVIALGLDSLGGNITLNEWHGFYGAIVVAFVATLIYWPFVGRLRRVVPFAVANIALDLALVSALVLFSGGSDSVFTFLYVVVPVYASLLLSGRGAVAIAALAGLSYAGVLAIEHAGVIGLASSARPDAVLFMRWAVHTGGLVLVAALASFLVEEIDRAGRALEQRTSDLAQLRSLHDRTVESLMSGLLTVDREGRVTSFNAEAERITGLSRTEACGRPVGEILPGIGAVLDPARLDPAGARARIPYLDRDGIRLHLGVGAYVLRDEAASEEGRVVIFQNVSQVVQMEEDLRRSERMAAIGTLAASIAHEIRNPLAAISGSIQMLRARTGADAGEPGRLMDIVIREVDRLNHLIGDFLGYAHPAPLATEPVDVAALVAEVVELVAPSAGSRVRLVAEVEPGLRALADPERLRQVLWNLLLNAIEAMPEGGRVRIEARRRSGDAPQGPDSPGRMDPEGKGTRVELAVMDQGIGVDAEIAERVFDPFFTTKSGGSGLGLPTVHRIIEEHGGSLRMERSSGEWSTVMRVRLPVAGDPA